MSDRYLVQFEVTDTFGGEANYSWVRRETVEIKNGTSDMALVRRLKKFAGFTGLKCHVDNTGDMIQVTPYGMCQTAFCVVQY